MTATLITGLVALATVAAMEGVAWTTHRYLMHGPLWVLHRSHHRPRRGAFEANDLFGLFFSLVSMALIYAGSGGAPVAMGLGLGMLGYGLIYFVAHDLLVHRRIPGLKIPRAGPLRRIYEAHRLHHAVRTRDGAVSFGFVWAPPPAVLAGRLRAARAPAGTRSGR